MEKVPPLQARLFALIEPAFLLYYAVRAYILTALAHLTQADLTPLYRPSSIRDEAFSRFWLALSDPSQIPDDPSKLVGSATLVPPLFAQVAGTVLEVGPGNGTQIRYFSAKQVDRIYAAEPATGLHAQLREQARLAGLGEQYTILSCPADPGKLAAALQEHGLQLKGAKARGQGLFDSIVCVRVLCSVPEPDAVARNLYTLLKPGGTLYTVEHVVNPWLSAKGSVLARAMQSLYELLGWRWFVGDCEMTRDTRSCLARPGAEDGGWAAVEVEQHFGWSALPYISGRYTKKK